MSNYLERDYDDLSCDLCGQTLPKGREEGEWAFEGFCDAECFVAMVRERDAFQPWESCLKILAQELRQLRDERAAATAF